MNDRDRRPYRLFAEKGEWFYVGQAGRVGPFKTLEKGLQALKPVLRTFGGVPAASHASRRDAARKENARKRNLGVL